TVLPSYFPAQASSFCSFMNNTYILLLYITCRFNAQMPADDVSHEACETASFKSLRLFIKEKED
ncbi:MAG: hypothetical protein IIY06_11050, partial [Proteobacteria bacterium]|nr:hypothetical protein [Pseudomonadota bacterium]